MADAQPVFESICASMSRLLPGADLAIGSLGDDGLIHWRAGFGDSLDVDAPAVPAARTGQRQAADGQGERSSPTCCTAKACPTACAKERAA